MPRLDESTVIRLISAVPDVNDSAIAVPSITVVPKELRRLLIGLWSCQSARVASDNDRAAGVAYWVT